MQKKYEIDLKIKLFGKRLCPTESVKYLGVKTDTDLSWQYNVIIFPLNWIEPVLCFSKWGNMLDLKY